jgi:hypothetical protein
MDIEAFHSELRNDPLGRGYSGMSISDLYQSFTTPNRTIVVPESNKTELSILRAFANPADADTCLKKIEALGESNTLVARAMAWIKPGAPGLDFGNSAVRAMLDSFHGANVITADELGVLKGLGERTISRLEEINCGDMTIKDVQYLRGLN